MIAHPIFAIVIGSDIVNTIICDDGYTTANYIARAAFGNDAFAVEMTQYDVAIGDKYHDGYFWHVSEDGEQRVDATPTAEEELPEIKAHLTEMDEYALNMDFQLALLQLGI